MKDEYDFSEAERGRFHRDRASLMLPVHLDPDVLAFIETQARSRGVTIDETVNALLREVMASLGPTPPR